MKILSKKNGKTANYSSLFLVKKELRTRQCVYISQQVHSTISRIVRVIAGNNVSVGGYIDNVLLHHLEMYIEEISDLYKKKQDDLIEFLKTE